MPRDLNDMIPSQGEISTLHVALEVSDRSWVLAIGAPLESGRASMHRLAPADTAALAGKIGNACAAMENSAQLPLTDEVGHNGSRLARLLAAGDSGPCSPPNGCVKCKQRISTTDDTSEPNVGGNLAFYGR